MISKEFTRYIGDVGAPASDSLALPLSIPHDLSMLEKVAAVLLAPPRGLSRRYTSFRSYLLGISVSKAP